MKLLMVTVQFNSWLFDLVELVGVRNGTLEEEQRMVKVKQSKIQFNSIIYDLQLN